ncbi:hypothetical protein [Corynebacterium terpenotabidum]|uniref:Uncharacterized protein n=1 Tax=Corynebacterium terpenotabidum Y-11 TaxID=1200352 RepID=S4XG00_9CORY|nr:hypothetical protein [Corynebacterium terpenotabidum]AGP31499.1 hypothetical protein A606_09290 [Corynebacterium terpenotabidum Y-11]
MNDRYRFTDDAARDGSVPVDADAVIQLDRWLDAVGTGNAPATDDPLLALLARTTAELDAREATAPVAVPDINALLDAEGAAPVTLVGPSGRHRRRRRFAGLTGRAAAAGGVSVTGMVIAGGVAAALAVGGFGVAAYHGVIPGIPALSDDGRDKGQQDGDGTVGSATPGLTESGAVDRSSTGPSSPADEAATTDPETPTEVVDPVEPREETDPAIEVSPTDPVSVVPGETTDQPEVAEPSPEAQPTGQETTTEGEAAKISTPAHSGVVSGTPTGS